MTTEFVNMKKIVFGLVLVGASLLSTLTTHAQIVVSVNIAPPELPVYEQPPIPHEGLLWTPGYWAWNADYEDYFWVPGTWVQAPYYGAMWTPGYWGWYGDNYVWHNGYWGDHVGFYGGVNYGYGYVGVGYLGGYWNNGVFTYNRSVNNFNNVQITHVYNSVVNVNVSRVSFNGGIGGVRSRPTDQQLAMANAPHMGPTSMQIRHEHAAYARPDLRASVNNGLPTIAATKGAPIPISDGNYRRRNDGHIDAMPISAIQSLPQSHLASQPSQYRIQSEHHMQNAPQIRESQQPHLVQVARYGVPPPHPTPPHQVREHEERHIR